jgi:DNA-binding SARP family transcriptional activator
MDGKITYHQQVSYCGKPRCRRCREGVGHGPYWYAYRTVNGRTVRTYIGKEPPPGVLEQQARESSAAASEFANTLLRLYVLGQFRLEQRVTPASGFAPGAQGGVEWEPVTDAALQHQRVRSLLSCLISSPGRKLGREQVMYALWRELDQEVAAHRLDRAVHSLRQVFEPGRVKPAPSRLLLTEHSQLALADQSLLWVDADAFESCIARGRAAQAQDPGLAEQLFEEAAALYNGDFLPEEDDKIEWVESRRDSLRRAWIGLLLELADLRIAREAEPAAIEILERLLAADPANEAAVQRLMTLLARIGRRSEAIQVYQRFTTMLKQEYKIAPLAQTRAIFEHILRGHLAPDTFPQPNAREGRLIGSSPDQSGGVRTTHMPPFDDNARSPAARYRETNGTLDTPGRTAPRTTGTDGALGMRTHGPGAGGTDGIRDAWRQSPDQSGQASIHRPSMVGGMSLPPVVPEHMHIGRTHQSPLVGRDEEIARLNELLRITEQTRRLRLAGQKRSSSLLAPLNVGGNRSPQCVMLMGDVGIGKTRLAEEAAREAKRRGWAVAWCRAYTQESNVPYRLWTETLRKAMSQGLWQRQEVSKRPLIYQPLRQLLPELQDLLPQSLQVMPPPPEQEQLRLWESTRALLSTISENTTLLIVLDDLQWADSSSCELLTYLVRHLREQPVMFLCTCRDTELPQGHHLRPLLTDLQREQAVEIVPVTPLSDTEMRALLAHLPTPVVESISERASGNPFFAEELARSIVGSSTELAPPDPENLPGTIQAVLDLRLARISQKCLRILERAAVLGDAFAFETIRDMASAGALFDEDELLDLLEEAMQAGMLTEEGSGMQIVYHFWHPLLLTYLYESLSAARKASLHRKAGQVLQAVYAGREAEGAAEIANHLDKGGGLPGQIAHYALLAADHAYALSAYQQAEKHYRLALTHLGDLTPTTSQNEKLQRAYILERLGECTMIVGKFEEARKFYEQVLEVRDKCVFASENEHKYEAQLRALLLCEIGQAWRYVGDSAQARTFFNQAEDLLRKEGINEGPAWAKIRYQQGNLYWREGNFEKARRTAMESLNIFKEVLPHETPSYDMLHSTRTMRTLAGNPVDLGRTHGLLANIVVNLGLNAEALEHFNTALAIFDQYDHKREIANVCCNLADLHLRRSEYNLTRSLLMRSRDIVERIGDTPVMSIVLINLGVLAARLGNLKEAESWYRQALSLTESVNDHFYISLFHTYVAIALIEQGKLDEAGPLLVQALKISRAKHIAPCTGFALVALGQLRLARATASTPPQAPGATSSPDARGGDRWLLRRARGTLERALTFEGLEADTVLNGRLLLARIALLLGEAEQARELASRVLDEATASELVWLRARAQALLGEILAALGEQEQAREYFQHALTTFAATGMRLEHARASQDCANALLRASSDRASREQALDYLNEARQVFQECHAALDLRSVERLLAAQSEPATPARKPGKRGR